MDNVFSSAVSSKAVGMPNLDFAAEEEALTQESQPKESALLRRLQSWLQHERDRQAENRYQMALDGEYYDGNQWLEEDAKVVESRGQAPLTFNEIAVSIRWITGSEKRNRVDWRVLPRTPDDSEGAGVKTKVMKYISDVNNVPFVRSTAFAEAAICGLSWIEDSISADASDDILYCGHQSWRTAYHDSYHQRADARDMRYFFRHKVLDTDIAKAMFAGKEAAIERAAMGAQMLDASSDDELWYLGSNISDKSRSYYGRTRLASVVNAAFSDRSRVKIWECWYREPMQTVVIRGGKFDGELYDESNQAMALEIQVGQAYAHPAVVMRVHCAFFVDDEILECSESPFKHNEIPFTPIYAFRRQRDGLPYGYVRNMRDPQDDLNKRMSKSLFILSVNQLITEKGAFDEEGEYTLQDAIDNVANPQGVFVLKNGQARFEIRRDYAEEQQQLLHVNLDRQFLQSASGVTDELLGRRTNATSGRAIEARQDQGSLATSDIFDNYRLAIRLSGQKQLSNAEKFYSMPKAIRLTEAKKEIEWVSINEPEIDPVTGAIRFINDITATKADFIVDEQDYRSSMRQAMFDSLSEMVSKIMAIAPQFGINMLDLLIDLADFPGKEEMVERVKGLIEQQNAPDPAAAEAAELQKAAAAAKIAKDEAAADKADAEADAIRMTIPPTAVATDLQRGGAVPGVVPGVPQEAAPMDGAVPAVPQGVAPMDGAATAPTSELAAILSQLVQMNAATAQAQAQSTEQLMAGLQALAGTMEAIAAGVEGVATVAQAAQNTAAQAQEAASQTAQATAASVSQVGETVKTVAASVDAVSASVEQVGETVSQVGQTVSEVAKVAESAKEGTKEVAGQVAEAVAELRKPRNRTIEFKNAQGQTVRATIKG